MKGSWLIAAALLLIGGSAGFGLYEVLVRRFLPASYQRNPRVEKKTNAQKKVLGALFVAARRIEQWLPMERSQNAACRDLLVRAGWKIEPETWRGIRIISLVSCGLIAGGLALLQGASRPLAAGGVAVIFAAFGWVLPRLVLARATMRRQQAIEAQLPDAMELLGISVAAGSPIEQSFREVALNLDEPLASEFSAVDREVNLLGHTRDQALMHVSERCASKDVAVFVAQFIQAISQGSSIAEGLAAQATLAHETAQAHALERIRKMPTKLDLVLSFCFLPPTIALVIVPTAMNLLKFLNDTLQ